MIYIAILKVNATVEVEKDLVEKNFRLSVAGAPERKVLSFSTESVDWVRNIEYIIKLIINHRFIDFRFNLTLSNLT